MFRKLFAIETAALQQRDADAGQDQSARIVTGPLVDMARFPAVPAGYGLWASRSSS
ncbi:MAG: hypothetical protein INR65_09520 [Gluconacetobacter diazotrophicus]|nr:hypothetical protein [Gluconacetobacter diazotrophicus]